MSCEEKIPEYYRHAAYSLREFKEFRDLIADRRNFEDARQEVIARFIKKNHTETIVHHKSFIKGIAFNVLREMLPRKINIENKQSQIPEDKHFEKHDRDELKKVRELLNQFIENNSQSAEQIDIIVDCIDRLKPEERSLFFDYYVNRAKMKAIASWVGLSTGRISQKCKIIRRKVRDCINGE